MLKKFVVRWSTRAKKDLVDIIQFIANGDGTETSVFYAEKISAGITRKISTLEYIPTGYSLVELPGNTKIDYRKVHYKHYNIYFYVDEKAKIVHITAIIDARRDPKYARSRLK